MGNTVREGLKSPLLWLALDQNVHILLLCAALPAVARGEGCNHRSG